jgi:hypothetical protein
MSLQKQAGELGAERLQDGSRRSIHWPTSGLSYIPTVIFHSHSAALRHNRSSKVQITGFVDGITILTRKIMAANFGLFSRALKNVCKCAKIDAHRNRPQL